MIFGDFPLNEALGAVLAHSLDVGAMRLRKGTVLLKADIAALKKAGIDSVTAARLEDGDTSEDAAAAQIGAALHKPEFRIADAATGRVNIYANVSGLFQADKALVSALNRIDPGITLATLADGIFVEAGRMVATVKIIPFAVAQTAVERVVQIAQQGVALNLSPVVKSRAALIATRLPVLKSSTMAKTERVLRERLSHFGVELVYKAQCEHNPQALSRALAEVEDAEIAIVFGASAIADLNDVIPAAIRHCAGGRVERFGMPVDPGNLLLLGAVKEMAVIGAPGCARSPVKNGFDWVLERLICGVSMPDEWWFGAGVGGLLLEASDRPQPREGH